MITYSDEYPPYTSAAKVLLDLIARKGYKKILEIGIYRCRTAVWILSRANHLVDEYWGIDRFDDFPPTRNTEAWKDYYKSACKYMNIYSKFRVLRLYSDNALDIFPDHSFDLIYIDGDHAYESVKKDIQGWLPKVKHGGHIGGHDYGGRYIGVKKAVDEVLSDKDVVIHQNSMVWLVEV